MRKTIMAGSLPRRHRRGKAGATLAVCPRFVILKDTERRNRRTAFVKCEDTVESEAMKTMADITFRERLPDYR
ncbi:MAG: hypothetical protein IJ678_01795, partial [Kiritimatiellae bacterium]|nr:hypothetical protein [Kiritimatiellia bacterium]